MRVSTNPIAVPRAFAVASVALFLVIAATGSGPALPSPASVEEPSVRLTRRDSACATQKTWFAFTS